jgi:hypothetical protein
MKKHLWLLVALIFFLALLVIGLLIYKDFGVPYDETSLVQIAAWNHRYIFKGDPALLSFQYRYYGVVYELPLFWLSTRFVKPEGVYVRHLVLFLAFLASLVVFYLLSRRLFRNPWWGILALVFLGVNPRIFADAFYNSKDIPFMEMFVLAFGSLVLFLDRAKEKRSLFALSGLVGLHALASALLVDTRVAGIAIVPLSLLLMAAVGLGSPGYWKQTLVSVFGYLILTAGLIILFWPVLWHDPVGEFISAFQQMSKYDYGKAVLYLGKYIGSHALPWHYLPVWIGISTPLVVLAGLLPGLLDWLRSVVEAVGGGIKGRLNGLAVAVSDPETLGWLAVIGWLVIPVTAIYWFHSVLYSGWRQMYFIYPPLVLISTRGFIALYGWFRRHTLRPIGVISATLLILAAGLAEPVGFMLRYHPNENVYFNRLAGDPAALRQRFELDYWGLSYKQAIDYILAHDPDKAIPIFFADSHGLDYINSALSSQQRSRLIVLDNQDKGARYFVGDFLFHPADYYPASKEYFSIIVRGVKIIVVYRLR